LDYFVLAMSTMLNSDHMMSSHSLLASVGLKLRC